MDNIKRKNMRLYTIIFVLLFGIKINAQSKFVSAIQFEIGKESSYKANLNEGKFIDDLSWAWSSQNACFPETQKQKFTGKHVLFTGIIPAHSVTTVVVTPKNKNANFSVYAYQISENESYTVPDLPRCVSCEADHKWDYKKRGKTQTHVRTITDFTAINNSYRLVIGVTGADGLATGEFEIKVITKKYY